MQTKTADTPTRATNTTEPQGILDQVAEETKTRGVYERMGEPMQAIEKLGKWFAASGLLGVKTPEQGYVVALTCMLEDITPLEFARTYDIVEGKPTKKSAATRAEFQRHGGRLVWKEFTAERCTIVASHPTLCPEGIPLTVTLKELIDSGVAMCWDKETRQLKLKDNYRRSPRQMLKERCSSELIRQIDPEINFGLYAPEELDDREEPPAAPAPAWSAPAEAPTQPQEAPATEQAPTPAPEQKAPPKTNGGAGDRAKKVLAVFKSSGLIQEDLELFAGGFEQPVPMAEWNDHHYEAFTEARKKIEGTKPEERAALVRELFQLGPGAEG